MPGRVEQVKIDLDFDPRSGVWGELTPRFVLLLHKPSADPLTPPRSMVYNAPMTYTINHAGKNDFRVLQVLEGGKTEWCQTYTTLAKAERCVRVLQVLAFFRANADKAVNVFDVKTVAKRVALTESQVRAALKELVASDLVKEYRFTRYTQSTNQSRYHFSTPHKHFEYALKRA